MSSSTQQPPTPQPDSSFLDSLPADLFDQTTLVSLASTVAILAAAYGLSTVALDRATRPAHRFLFVWHAFDALIHFILEGSFLYHSFFSWLPLSSVPNPVALAPTAHNFLGYSGRAYGPQAGGDDFFAQLWMVYAKADRRWAGADLVRSFLYIIHPLPPVVSRAFVALTFRCSTVCHQPGTADGVRGGPAGVPHLLRAGAAGPAHQRADDRGRDHGALRRLHHLLP